MSVETEKNIYGLSEGVFKACQFLGLEFPPTQSDESAKEHMPSDYFGDDFEFDEATIKKLCAKRRWTNETFTRIYDSFSKKYAAQKPLKQTKTDLNIYFCDHALFDGEQGANYENYLDFEFYNKSFALRDEFITHRYRDRTQIICNDYHGKVLADDKAKADAFFAEFLRRDWLDTRNCTLDEFKAFVEKHPRFFSKPVGGTFGIGADIIEVDPTKNLRKTFVNLKRRRRLLEEVVKQHEQTALLCPDTVNTIRVYTLLDSHNVVHILSTAGRIGRIGGVADSIHRGGYSVIIDSKTGIITSDGLSNLHERVEKHADTGITFKGFQYPCWDKICALAKKAAKMIPHLRHIGWDIAVNSEGEAVIIEVNGNHPGEGLQQEADSKGRRYLYEPFHEELQNYQEAQMKILGYRVNALPDFDAAYDTILRKDNRLEFAVGKLIPDCTSLIDLGCREAKFVKSVCPEKIKYYPVDFKNYDDDEIIACDFNNGEFPDLKADTILCAFTAEYVELLPQFLSNMCHAAQKQILMFCRPVDKESNNYYRWTNPFLTDFTEEFLIQSLAKNNFKLNATYPVRGNPSIAFYDFRRN